MKIVDRATFLGLPEGTLFAKYMPCVFDEMRIKGQSIGAIDFWVQSLNDAIDHNDSGDFIDLLNTAEHDGASVPMDFHCESRDGLFDEEQLFAVWEKGDVQKLIARLQEALEEAYQVKTDSPPTSAQD